MSNTGLHDSLIERLQEYISNIVGEIPKIIIVGQEETLINNALMMVLAEKGITAEVITPLQAKHLDAEIELGLNIVKVEKREPIPIPILPIEKFNDAIILTNKNEVNPAARRFRRRHF